MSFQSENERNKAVVDAFYQLGIQGRLTDFAQYLDQLHLDRGIPSCRLDTARIINTSSSRTASEPLE